MSLQNHALTLGKSENVSGTFGLSCAETVPAGERHLILWLSDKSPAVQDAGQRVRLAMAAAKRTPHPRVLRLLAEEVAALERAR